MNSDINKQPWRNEYISRNILPTKTKSRSKENLNRLTSKGTESVI